LIQIYVKVEMFSRIRNELPPEGVTNLFFHAAFKFESLTMSAIFLDLKGNLGDFIVLREHCATNVGERSVAQRETENSRVIKTPSQEIEEWAITQPLSPPAAAQFRPVPLVSRPFAPRVARRLSRLA
jgi:hypothetical protein